jgi:hypothetical protein
MKPALTSPQRSRVFGMAGPTAPIYLEGSSVANPATAVALLGLAMPDPLEVFRARCWAKALLVREGLANLQDSVDQLQNVVVAYGLAPDDRSQDAIQKIMEDAFKAAEIDIRPEPSTLGQPQPYRTAASTIAAFWYVVGLDEPDRLAGWLRERPHDAPTLLRLLENK